MTLYLVHVRYRTNSGCNTRNLEVEAPDMNTAIKIACDKQRNRRGVIRIDGGDVTESHGDGWYSHHHQETLT